MDFPQPAASPIPDEIVPIPPDLGRELQHLWAPWRMRYVGGGAKETGCLFCNRFRSADDVASLIVHRAERSFVIMNLFPYNTGHVMIVPNEHVASPEAADSLTLAEMATLLQPVLRSLRRVLDCDGFNVGMNVGAVAGAGVADHLHQHVVPRWTGDANFMPILASTMVMPELIPVTYAKIRAELPRAFAPPDTDPNRVTAVVLTRDRERVLMAPGPEGADLPRATAPVDEPLWRAAYGALSHLNVPVELAGWAGPQRAVPTDLLALTFLLPPEVSAGSDRVTSNWRLEPIPSALKSLGTDRARRAVTDALANLAPEATSRLP